jgi:vitamin B12 transporter
MRLRGFALAVLSLSFNPTAWADEPVHREEVVVTADRLERPVRETGSDVTIIDEAEIKRRGATFLADVLRGQPGVGVTQTGGPGGQVAVRLRGEEGYRTLLLIDGMKVSDPSGTQVTPYFTNLPASNIERIEIVRGPQSLLYGADAIGGVINIITKRGAPGTQFGGSAISGSFGTVAGSAHLRGAQGLFEWSLAGEQYDTDGFSAKNGPGFVEDDGFDNGYVHGIIGISPGENLRLEAIARYTDSEVEFDAFSDSDSVLYTEQFAGQLSAKGSWDGFGAEAKLAYFSQNRADYDSGAPNVFGSRFDAERDRADFLATWQIAPSHRVLGGFDFEHERATTDALDTGRDATGVFAEWIGRFDQLFLSAGARFDDHSQFGDHTSWRGTAAYLVRLRESGTIKLRASYGTGFRAPSLFELYDGFSGDPTLKEETGYGWDTGIDVIFARGSLSLTYFDQHIEDEIRFDPTFFVYFQSDSHSTSRGVEFSGEVLLTDGLTLAGSYTYTDARVASRDAENGLPRLRRPRHSGSATINYAFLDGRANVNAAFEFAAKHEDGFFIFRTPLDGHGVVNLTASFAIIDGIELAVKGVNLFDEQYVEASGYATQGASIYGGISAAF